MNEDIANLFIELSDKLHGMETDVVVPALANLLAQTMYLSGGSKRSALAYMADVIDFTFKEMGDDATKQ